MGNCINKNRMYVLRTCNFRRYSDQEYIQGPEIEGVERDNCKLVGRSSERQKQNNIEFQKTDVQKKRLLNQPSPSGNYLSLSLCFICICSVHKHLLDF